MNSLRLFLTAILLALAACQNQSPSHEPRIHGDVGVRMQSRDTTRIDPTR